jgi:hypothetical protein
MNQLEVSEDNLSNSKNEKEIRMGVEKKLREYNQSSRSSIVNITATNPNIGPGKYAEIRSAFPLYVDELFEKKLQGTIPLTPRKTESQEEHIGETPRDIGCNYFFKLRVNRRIQTPSRPVPPGPGTYSYKSSTQSVIERKSIGRKGKFFSCSLKTFFARDKLVCLLYRARLPPTNMKEWCNRSNSLMTPPDIFTMDAMRYSCPKLLHQCRIRTVLL